MLAPLLLAFTLLFPTPVSAALKVDNMQATVADTRFPLKNSNPDELSDGHSRMRNVLTVTRDFGPDPEDISIDSWVTRGADPKLEEVRIWFVRHDESERRHPFTKKVLKNLTVGYKRGGNDNWKVGFAGGRKQYLFDVELDDRGRPAIYSDVVVGKTTLKHCRVQRAHLVARRVLGVPTGVKHLRVACVDARGVRHRGRAVSTRT